MSERVIVPVNQGNSGGGVRRVTAVSDRVIDRSDSNRRELIVVNSNNDDGSDNHGIVSRVFGEESVFGLLAQATGVSALPAAVAMRVGGRFGILPSTRGEAKRMMEVESGDRIAAIRKEIVKHERLVTTPGFLESEGERKVPKRVRDSLVLAREVSAPEPEFITEGSPVITKWEDEETQIVVAGVLRGGRLEQLVDDVVERARRMALIEAGRVVVAKRTERALVDSLKGTIQLITLTGKQALFLGPIVGADCGFKPIMITGGASITLTHAREEDWIPMADGMKRFKNPTKVVWLYTGNEEEFASMLRDHTVAFPGKAIPDGVERVGILVKKGAMLGLPPRLLPLKKWRDKFKPGEDIIQGVVRMLVGDKENASQPGGLSIMIQGTNVERVMPVPDVWAAEEIVQTARDTIITGNDLAADCKGVVNNAGNSPVTAYELVISGAPRASVVYPLAQRRLGRFNHEDESGGQRAPPPGNSNSSGRPPSPARPAHSAESPGRVAEAKSFLNNMRDPGNQNAFWQWALATTEGNVSLANEKAGKMIEAARRVAGE